MNKTKILIIGANSFVGHHLLVHLQRHYSRVMPTVNKSANKLNGIPHDAPVMRLDVTNLQQMRSLFYHHRPEVVINLAAYGNAPKHHNHQLIFDTCLTGTLNLLKMCDMFEVSHFINTGSSAEYGHQAIPFKENQAPRPRTTYAIAKSAATALCHEVYKHVKITTLRLFSVYGSGEEDYRLIPRLIEFGKRSELPPLADPHTARDFVHIDDVCEAYRLAIERQPAGIFNVGSGEMTTLSEAVKLSAELFRFNAQPQWNQLSRPDDCENWLADIEKAEQILGWTPRYNFREGFKSLL